jgi:hypothetical protein
VTDSSPRLAAGVGVAFLLVDLTAILLGGPLPALDDPAGRISEFYAGDAGYLLAQAYVRGLAMGLLVWFFALLVDQFNDRGGPAGRVWFASAVVVAAVELVRVAVVAAVALQPERVSESGVVVLHAAGLILGGVIAFPLAAGQVAACLLLRDSRLPGWLVPAGAALGAGWLLTGIRSVSESHALWAAGTVVTFLWGLWLLAICAALAFRDRR